MWCGRIVRTKKLSTQQACPRAKRQVSKLYWQGVLSRSYLLVPTSGEQRLKVRAAD